MNQQQPSREDDQYQQEGAAQQVQGIKYGDRFVVSGDLAGPTIAQHDAATMQRAEYVILGGLVPGGPANTMASAAAVKQYYGAVGSDQASGAAHNQGITVTETPVVGGGIVTEFVAGQVVAQYLVGDAGQGGASGQGGGVGEGQGGGVGEGQGGVGGDIQSGDQGGDERVSNIEDDTKITIGEALEASGRAIGDQPIQPSDVAAIRAAEARATGVDAIMPGGLTDQATAAATANVWATCDESKVKLGDILSDATAKLPTDKPVEPEDALRVVDAEVGSKPDSRTRPGGVAAAVVTAAHVNQDNI